MKESFRFFSTFLETGKKLPTPELQAKFFIALAEYGLEGKEPDDPILQALLVAPKFTIDKSAWISVSASDRGKNWWAPKGNQNASKNWENISKQANSSKNKLKQAETSEVEVEEEVENKIKEKNKKEKSEDAFASLTVGTYFESLSSEVQKAYLDFLKNREAMKIKNTPEATKQHLNLLKKIGNSQLQLATLEKAIGANWRGLFELNESEKKIVLAKASPPKRMQEPDFSWVDQDILWKT